MTDDDKTPADRLMDASGGIHRALALGHPVWGDGQALDHGWPYMLAWNLALGGLCEAAGGAMLGWQP